MLQPNRLEGKPWALRLQPQSKTFVSSQLTSLHWERMKRNVVHVGRPQGPTDLNSKPRSQLNTWSSKSCNATVNICRVISRTDLEGGLQATTPPRGDTSAPSADSWTNHWPRAAASGIVLGMNTHSCLLSKSDENFGPLWDQHFTERCSQQSNSVL